MPPDGPERDFNESATLLMGSFVSEGATFYNLNGQLVCSISFQYLSGLSGAAALFAMVKNLTNCQGHIVILFNNRKLDSRLPCDGTWRSVYELEAIAITAPPSSR